MDSDQITGYVDMVPLGQYEYINQTLIDFIVYDLHKSSKQPVANFFSKDCIKTNQLKLIFDEIITRLQQFGIREQYTIHSFQLSSKNDSQGLFLLKFYFFDKHLLRKSTNNALFKYDP